jgi:sec-independent protein translocase protein TatA
MADIGPMEIVLLLGLAVLLFGPKRLPEIGRSLGSGLREFRNSVTGERAPEPRAEIPPQAPPADPVPPQTGA